MDHHEAVRTPSTSSAHSESEVAMPTKFKLVNFSFYFINGNIVG